MKSKIKNTLLSWKLRNLPKEQKDMIMFLVEKDPELFEKIGEEIKSRKKQGQDEGLATAAVFKEYQNKMQKYILEYQQKAYRK